MKTRTKYKEIKYNKKPWRGAFTTVAEQMGTSRQNIVQKFYRLDPDVTEKVTAEIKRRERIMKKSSHHLVEA